MAKDALDKALRDHLEKLNVFKAKRTDAVDTWERFVCDMAALNRIWISAAVTIALH